MDKPLVTMHDDDTPVQVVLPEFVIEQLTVQLTSLRQEHELWRPIVETAKILSNRWKESAGDFSPEVSNAMDMLFSMICAAESARRDADG